jgi:phenylacetate-CoA ligase
VVDKRLIRATPRAFASTRAFGRTTTKTTSGSTSEPFTIYKDAEAMAREQAAMFRAYAWAGIAPGMRQARFWGNPLSIRARIHAAIRDLALNRTRFSAFDYSAAEFEKCAARLRKQGPCYLYGYASALHQFALHVQQRDYHFVNIEAVITTSDMLTEQARTCISEALSAPVFNEYGCAEAGVIAHEDLSGRMYINAENVCIEVLNEHGNVTTEGEGTLIVTELHNRVQPLIRYTLGDRGAIGHAPEPGHKGLPIITRLDGRIRDELVGPRGERYSSSYIAYLFKELHEHIPIRQYQAIQTGRLLRFRIAVSDTYRESIEKRLDALVRKSFGDYFRCKFEYPEIILPESSGKFRQFVQQSAHRNEDAL